MKKVLIINHYAGAPPYGMEYRHYEIAKELVQQGVKVCIVASTFTHLRKTPKVENEIIDDIHFKWIKTTQYKTYGIGRLLNMIIFSIRLWIKTDLPFNPNIIIVSSPSPFPILNAIQLKKKYKAKLVYEIRDVWPKSIIELNGTSAKHPLMRFLDWVDTLGIKKSDIILSPLSNIKTYIAEKGFNKKIIILPNGITQYTKGIKNSESKKDKQDFIVGYGGTIGDSNSIMNLIAAAVVLKEEKNIQFKIVGDGSRYEDVKRIIKSEQLNNVKLYGRVPQEKLHKILAGCTILYKGNPKIHIYKYGVSSIKMVEYLLLKKPIIDASYGVDIVQKAKCGIIVPYENSKELAQGILKMKAMGSKQLERMGENGFQYVVNNYLYSNSVREMLKEL